MTAVEGVTIEDSIIKNNDAVYGGGPLKTLQPMTTSLFLGVYATNLTELRLNGTDAVGNKASVKGGMLYASKTGSFHILFSLVKSNSAKHDGGAIYLKELPLLRIDNATLESNEVANGSGGAFSISGAKELRITNVTFEKNRAHGSGGAITMNEPDKTTVTKTKFLSNKALEGSGGALHFCPPPRHSNKHSISKKTTHDSSDKEEDKQPAVVVGDRVRFTDVVFNGNEATENGGSVYLQDMVGNVVIEESSFAGCRTQDGCGGCLYLDSV